MPPQGVTLVIKVVTDTANAVKGMADVAKGVEGAEKSLDPKFLAAAAGVAGAAVAAGVALKEMGDAAAQDAAEHERLNQAFIASGAATGDYNAVIDEAIAKGQELAFTDTEIRDALVPLVAATGDAALAADSLALAQDIARLKGVDLATAAEAVAKAQNGSATALARLVGVSAQGKDATEILTEAQAMAAGQAEAYGNTTAGQAESMKIAFSELAETIGTAVIPVFNAIMPALQPLLIALGELIEALLPVLIPLLNLVSKALVGVANVLVRVVDQIARFVTWVYDAISAVGDFLATMNPFDEAMDKVSNIGGKTLMVQPMAAPAATSTPASRRLPTQKVEVTHKIEDPKGVLRDIPGGAAAVARILQRGTDATPLFRNLQQAAGVR